MSLVITSNVADVSAASAVEQHHAQLAGALAVRVRAVLTSATRCDVDAVHAEVAQLVAWCRGELVPHAVAEETSFYAAAHRRAEGELLVDAMRAEHRVIVDLLGEIDAAASPVAASANARALQVLFDSHLQKENTLLLPLLVAAPDVSLADLLGDLHELVGRAAPTRGPGKRGPGGDDSEADTSEHPEFDARAIPHATRHAAIFAALDAVRPGRGLVLLAPHDPIPLLAQLKRRNPGAFTVVYLENGPDDWRLAFVRRAI